MSRSHDDPADDARLGNVLGALALSVADRMRHATEEAAGHTAAAPGALVMLSEFRPGASVEELRHAIGLTHSGAVRLVDRLVGDGDVERRAATDDGRSVSLALTPKGKRAASRIRVARSRALRDTLAPLTATERTTLTGIVEKLVRGVTRDRLADRERGAPPDGWLCRLCDPTACRRRDGRCPAMETAMAQRGAGPPQ